MKKVKNSWSEGLIMDFAPENTSPNSLTSALNATILTYNGNEMMLQNDMGNARIETAFLPEGYVPVGTCEYGDIIYVVSYNPLINKSQIGCFPSPERNISSEEIGQCNQTLSSSDFQEVRDGKLTGNLISSSVKKIVYDRNLQPGDKYFIYQKVGEDGEEDSFKNFSDYNGERLNSFPKYLKAHVVSIQDDGKIELLDSSVKWYDKYFIPTIQQESEKYDIDSYRDALSSGYSIFSSKISGKLALLVELEKITGFNCTYNVYPNDDKYKVYWNISWSTDNNDINPKYIVLTKSESTEQNIPKAYPDEGYYYKEITSELNNSTYSNYQNTNYNQSINKLAYNIITTDKYGNSIMPIPTKRIIDCKKAIHAQQNNFPRENYYYLDAVTTSIGEINIAYKNAQGEILKPDYIHDDIINNYFKSTVYKEFADFDKGDKGDYIYNYEITPAMPYGLLEEYAIQGSIDFSKVGKDFIELHTWKYYNTEDYATLTLGLDAYVSENKAIAGVDLKFYDAHGLSAVYTINNKESYSGTFTEYIPLNGINTSPKLINRDNNTLIIHKGNSLNDLGITELQEGYLYETDERLYIINIADDQNPHLSKKEDIIYIDPTSENFEFNKCFINDSGILYSNILYGVEIIIKYYYLDSLGNYDITDESSFKREYRWMWTNQMLNPQYKYLKDFKDAVGDLILDVDAYYNINDKWFKNQYLLDYGLQETNNSQELYKNLSANVQEVSESYNIDGNIVIKLKDNYNTFKLNAGEKNAETSILKSNTKLFVYEGASHIENIEGTVIQTDESKFDIFNGIYPIDNNDLSIKPTESIIDNPIFGKEISNETTLYYYKDTTTGEIIRSSTLPTDITQYSLYSKPVPIIIENIDNLDKIVITLTSNYVLNFDKSVTEQPTPQTMSVLSEGIDTTQRIPINGFGSNINIGIGGSNNSSNESTEDSSNDTSLPIITGGYKPDNTPIEDLEDIPLDPKWTDVGTIGCNTQPGNYLYTLEFNRKQIQNNLIYIRIPYELKFIETESNKVKLINIYPEIRILNTKYYSSSKFIPINGVKQLDGSYIYMSNNVLTIQKPIEQPTEQNEEQSGEQSEEQPIEIKIISKNNDSVEVLKAGGLILPTEDLNTENWDKYKNQYYLNIKNSTEQSNVNINYITSTNQEINIQNTYGIDLTNQMDNYLKGKPIPLKYAFSGVHYSKYYKEVQKTTKQLQILVPLLNTVQDLSKYNLRIGDDQKLYFSQFVGMGVGYGDHSHRRITLYQSNNTTVGNKTITHYVSNGGNNKIGITKYSNSHQYWSLWQTKLPFDSGEEYYLKDLINGIVPVLFGNQNRSDPTTIKIVEDYNREIEIAKNPILPDSYIIPTISADGYSFNGDQNKIGLCSFLMKDVNGDIHALNNLFPLIVNKSNEITQSVITNDTIGNLIASPLSNMYIVSNQYSDLSSNYISNIVHLRNQKSKFTKDLIYKFSIQLKGDTQFKDLLLICGVSLKTYITNIKNKCPGLLVDQVNIGINDIIKNIPMQFEFDYIEPDKSIINDEIKKVYIRKSNNDFYSIEPINYNLEQNSIYFINTNNIIEKLHSYIQFKNIESVTLNDNGIVKFNYYDTWRTHPDMEYFTYKNNMLTLVNTNYPSSQLYGIKLNGRNEGISGIVKNEYLTIEGKYA